MSYTSTRINKISEMFNYTRYLEIGIRDGGTFLNVHMPHKTAVDEHFQIETKTHAIPPITFYEMSPDVFFQTLPEKLNQLPYSESKSNEFKFDIIFFGFEHSFTQSYKNFLNSLPFTHDRTVWILDNTVPSDPWSALPDQNWSYTYRAQAQVADKPWHGDVYKTILAIHDFHQDFSYATQVDTGNPQTIIWKTDRHERQQVFGSFELIQKITYFDLLDNIHLLLPTNELSVIELIGLKLNPLEYKNNNDFKKVIKPIQIRKS